MKREKYSIELNKLERLIENSDIITEEILDRLKQLYEYKPVTNVWHRLKCKAYIKCGRAKEIASAYEKMICLYSKSENNIALWKEYINSLMACGKIYEAKRYRYMMGKLLNDSECEKDEEKLAEYKGKIIEEGDSEELLIAVEEYFYITGDRIAAYIIYLYRIHIYPNSIKDDDEIKYDGITNKQYIKECIESKETIIIVSDDARKDNYEIISYILSVLGIKVFMIGETITSEGDFRLDSSVSISIDNSEEFEDCTYIRAISRKNGTLEETNISYIIDYICKNKTENDFVLVIANNRYQEEFRTHKVFAKRYEKLSNRMPKYMSDTIGIGWAGDYYTYISRLYKKDVREWINRETEYDFSIVIPVRNATDTLFYTLKTCIEQDYQGKYEVVLSDNSMEGHDVAYEIYKKLNDPHIKYYKTPCSLTLTKSFEFACLQTKGKYIISLGADDGILPWTLSILYQAWEDKNIGSNNILKWERGFYAWPGFNGGQENQFCIPKFYRKNNVSCSYEMSENYLKNIFCEPSYMYVLPNMYINSGFKREHIKKLYEKTGRLWDGFSQDIYMGVTNLMIMDKIVNISYPLTIAGMSSSSIGATCNSNSKNVVEYDKKNINIANYGENNSCVVFLDSIDNMPYIGTDVGDLYASIYYLNNKRIGKEMFNQEKDIKTAFLKIYNSVSVLDDKLETYIELGKHAAMLRGEEFLNWFNTEIANVLLNDKIKYSDEDKAIDYKKKKFIEGYDDCGGVILDASRFGVQNIYEAVQLFKSFLRF